MRGDGRVYQRGNRWWLEYWVRGKQFRESGGASEKEARRRLKARLQEIHGDRFVGPREERTTVGELLDNLILHLETKGAKSVRVYREHLKPIREAFSLTRAVDLTTEQVERFIMERREAGRKPATINRETGALKQALNLARKQGRLNRLPYIPSLKEDNARQGFFERAEFETIAANLPAPLDDIARFAYLSGWRKSEIVTLRWDAVDRAAREVRLRTSKNGRPRTLPLEGELWDLIERRWTAREYCRHGLDGLSDYIFHRGGRPVRDFRRAWSNACMDANLPGKLFHDFRRTAVRDLTRAGTPQSVAMAITGHRTVSVFLRYNIANGEDMRKAIRRTQEYRASRPGQRKVLPFSSEGGNK